MKDDGPNRSNIDQNWLPFRGMAGDWLLLRDCWPNKFDRSGINVFILNRSRGPIETKHCSHYSGLPPAKLAATVLRWASTSVNRQSLHIKTWGGRKKSYAAFVSLWCLKLLAVDILTFESTETDLQLTVLLHLQEIIGPSVQFIGWGSKLSWFHLWLCNEQNWQIWWAERWWWWCSVHVARKQRF